MKISRAAFLKKAGLASLAAASVPALGHLSADEALGKADHVRWDIIHLNPLPPAAGSVFTAGGEAFAFAYHTPSNPSTAKIRLTGSGTFAAPASGGSSGAATGGGTWETSGEGLPTGSGTYRVTKLVSWVFASFQSAAGLVDNIGDTAERANGTAVLLVEYNDGSQGMLGVGCHGPGAPNGIFEGVIATKGHLTYWNGELPVGAMDKNRTLWTDEGA